MYIPIDLIITIASVVSALTVILTFMFGVYRWIERQKQQDVDIQEVKDEQTMICYVLLATLDGLKQLGANGEVTKAHDAMEKHMNKKAHK